MDDIKQQFEKDLNELMDSNGLPRISFEVNELGQYKGMLAWSAFKGYQAFQKRAGERIEKAEDKNNG